MTFKPHEIDFMRQAELGRLATIQPNGTPQNSPVGFTYNEELGTIDIAGYNMSKSQKFRNIAHNDKVAFVVDDITSRDPWRVRCLEIRGTAEQAQIAPSRGCGRGRAGHGDHPAHSARIISFGIDEPDTEPPAHGGQTRRVGAQAPASRRETPFSGRVRGPRRAAAHACRQAATPRPR